MSTTLYVSHLPKFCTEDELFHLFAPFGHVSEVKVAVKPDHTSSGHVTFSNPEAANIARMRVDGFMYLGRTLR
jgi:RNA recognition motif-containing protein